MLRNFPMQYSSLPNIEMSSRMKNEEFLNMRLQEIEYKITSQDNSTRDIYNEIKNLHIDYDTMIRKVKKNSSKATMELKSLENYYQNGTLVIERLTDEIIRLNQDSFSFIDQLHSIEFRKPNTRPSISFENDQRIRLLGEKFDSIHAKQTNMKQLHFRLESDIIQISKLLNSNLLELSDLAKISFKTNYENTNELNKATWQFSQRTASSSVYQKETLKRINYLSSELDAMKQQLISEKSLRNDFKMKSLEQTSETLKFLQKCYTDSMDKLEHFALSLKEKLSTIDEISQIQLDQWQRRFIKILLDTSSKTQQELDEISKTIHLKFVNVISSQRETRNSTHLEILTEKIDFTQIEEIAKEIKLPLLSKFGSLNLNIQILEELLRDDLRNKPAKLSQKLASTKGKDNSNLFSALEIDIDNFKDDFFEKLTTFEEEIENQTNAVMTEFSSNIPQNTKGLLIQLRNLHDNLDEDIFKKDLAKRMSLIEMQDEKCMEDFDEKMKLVRKPEEGIQNQILELNQECQNIKTELDETSTNEKVISQTIMGLIDEQTSQRMQNRKSLETQLELIEIPNYPADSIHTEEMNKISVIIRQLAESIFILRSALEWKLNSAINSRVDDVRILKTDLEDLENEIKFFVDQYEVNPDADDFRLIQFKQQFLEWFEKIKSDQKPTDQIQD